MAPNLDPRASPGSFFQARSSGRHQIQPWWEKLHKILVDLGRVGSGFFGIFGFSPNGKPRPWLDSSRPGESKNAIFGQKIQVFGLFLAISHYLGVPPGVPPSLLLAPLGHLTVFIYVGVSPLTQILVPREARSNVLCPPDCSISQDDHPR